MAECSPHRPEWTTPPGEPRVLAVLRLSSEKNVQMHVYVETHVDDDGYPPFKAEELDAEELGPGRARLLGVPLFVYGMARGDVFQFEVRRSDGLPWLVAVVEHSGHWTARVVSLVGEDLESIARQFVELGCDAYSTPYGLVPIDVPPEVAKEPVLALLRAGRANSRWDFDLGVDPEAAVLERPPGRSARRAPRWFGRGPRRSS